MLTELDHIGKRFAFIRTVEALYEGEFVDIEGSEIEGVKYVKAYLENARSFDKFFQQEIITTRLKEQGMQSWAIGDYRESKRIYQEMMGENPMISYRKALNHSLKILRHPERATEMERKDLAEFLLNYHAKIPKTSIWDKMDD